ncbi:MAG: 3-oxo-tetronate kinase [Pseudomonadota bacterium]|jgi:uncharacterized protein YgbK (DUF1537 family)
MGGIVLGAIADDFTGATDLASTLVRGGMRAVQLLGVPTAEERVCDADAVVIALKSRSIPASQAVEQSRAALEWLRQAGARRFYFKYCSTFDSTPSGNIGPVADALCEALGAGFTVFNPAFPANGRTVYQGHLFVGGVLLSESGMQHHPLNPMTDASLPRVLQQQTPHRVGLVPVEVVEQGRDAVRSAFADLQARGVRHAILDTLNERHLATLGEACADLPLVTGGSGMAMGLPAQYVRAGWLASRGRPRLPAIDGYAAVIAGSCSAATRAQVAHMSRTHAAFAVDPFAALQGVDVVGAALAWARSRLSGTPLLIHATASPERVEALQERLGREPAGALVESLLSGIAEGLVDAGVRRLVVAGGETSGAVVRELGVRALEIGEEIDPGVPWTASLGDRPLALALKSGNFGAEDFFTRAFGCYR